MYEESSFFFISPSDLRWAIAKEALEDFCDDKPYPDEDDAIDWVDEPVDGKLGPEFMKLQEACEQECKWDVIPRLLPCLRLPLVNL